MYIQEKKGIFFFDFKHFSVVEKTICYLFLLNASQIYAFFFKFAKISMQYHLNRNL